MNNSHETQLPFVPNSISFAIPKADSCPVKATAVKSCWEVAKSNELFHFTYNICRDCRIYIFSS